MGNHDSYPTAEYLKYFEKLYGAIGVGKDFLLTHIPVQVSQFERWKYNIHGHLHTNKIMIRTHNITTGDTGSEPDERYINVSCEQINLTPISIEDLKARQPI